MRRNYLFLYCMAGIVAILFAACEKNNVETPTSDLTVIIKAPSGLDGAKFENSSVVLKERNTGSEIKGTEKFDNNMMVIKVPEGVYDINIEGKIKYMMDNKEHSFAAKGYKESVVVKGEKASVEIDLFIHNDKADFLIQEIFFTGTLTPQGKQYNGDKYIKIYNNSDKVLYADGLFIAQSEFLTVIKQTYKPDIMKQAVAVDAIIVVPGSGKDYPVKPGESILIADDAINHKEKNPNSYNLSIANFEWFYETLKSDVDNPAVKNMVNLYDRLIMHNRGFKSFIIGRINVDNEKFLKEYKYHYDYDFVFNGVTYPMDGDCYKIPNEWILDAVNLSVASEFQWIVTDPSIDMGWTYCGKVDKDANRYGKCVKRKVLTTTSTGMKILKDTNNSTVDFEAEAKPSL